MGHYSEFSYIKLGLSKENLQEDNFQFLLGSAWIFPSYLSKFSAPFAHSWNNLVLDTYMKEGDNYRYRRFGRFKYDDTTGHVDPALESSFFQSTLINNYAEEIDRKFTHVEGLSITIDYFTTLCTSSNEKIFKGQFQVYILKIKKE